MAPMAVARHSQRRAAVRHDIDQLRIAHRHVILYLHSADTTSDVQETDGATLAGPDTEPETPQNMTRAASGKRKANQQMLPRKAADRSTRRQPRRWSILTAEDHIWFMENQGAEVCTSHRLHGQGVGGATPRSFLNSNVRLAGKQLRGVDAERMEALQVRVGVERQQNAEEQWKAACANRDIYNYATPAAREHMEARCLRPVLWAPICVCKAPCCAWLSDMLVACMFSSCLLCCAGGCCP